VKPAPFAYVRAETVEEAVDALAAHGPDAKVLAGGQSLVPALNMRLVRPGALVDINRVFDLDNAWADDCRSRLGALVRQSDPRALVHPLVAEALPHVGHFVTRNRGTVAGSVAHADPAAELPVCLVLAGGSVVARSSRGEREVAADDLFVGPYTTVLEPDELVVETRWPAPEPEHGYAFCEFAQRRGDYALCIAAAAVGGVVLRVAVGSVVERPTILEVDPEHPGEAAAAQVEPWGTLHAQPAYLTNLVRVLVDRAVTRARERAAAA
jgi:CO/xanthine dehydrogenase FAD-binding subunit